MGDNSMFKVFLRLRNSKTADKTDEVYTLDDEEPATLVASAPETSETHKNSQRIHTLSVQKFKFSKIFLPSTEQAELFESTALPLLEETLNLENNSLLFTYGVTNSGKTHTVQGPKDNAGLLPRSLDLIFNTLGANIKPKSIFCPFLHNDVSKMTEKLQLQKEHLKQKIIYPPNMSQDLDITGMTDPNSTRCTAGTLSSMISDSTTFAGDNLSYQITDNVTVQLNNSENIQYSVWVSYIELYNENIYDLLQPPPEQGEMKTQGRLALRLGEDHNMSVYVKGVNQLEVCSFAEANRALVYGQRNRKRAATQMNQSSSRSHAIFKISIIATNTVSQQSSCSQMTFVDLAGSERYGKTNAAGVRLKEAGNINTSLLTLGKCISSLKHNTKSRGRHGSQAVIVPFRESKLTRLFKNFLAGEGLMSMIVCVNPHEDFFDESIHALKFSALATEALLLPRPVPASQQKLAAPTEAMRASLTEEERHNIRAEVLADCNARIKRIKQNHEQEIEEIEEKETVYREGKEQALQDYYFGVIEELKQKVRDAREKNGSTNAVAEHDATTADIQRLQQQCQSLQEELKGTHSEHKKFKSEMDQKLFQTKLELRTTQKMYNDGVREKDRFVEVVAEKDTEIKIMFGDIEEATKLSTFWEKECSDLKTTSAKQLEVIQGQLKEDQVKQQQLQALLLEKDDVIKQHALREQEGTFKLQKEICALKEELNTVKTSASTSLELEQLLLRANDELKDVRESNKAGKQEISNLKESCSDYTSTITNLKNQLVELQEVLSEQETKENVPVSREDGVKSKPASKELEDGLRNRLISAQEQIMEKNKMVAQLQGEVGDMVRSKALQFDALICKKEKECEDLLAELATKSEENSALTNQVEELMDSEKKQSKTILQLQDLASVQKNHLVSVEESSRVEKEKLQDKLEKIKTDQPVSIPSSKEVGELRAQLETARLQHELSRQQSDRVKVELAAAHRKFTDIDLKNKDNLAAKEIQLQNWYLEKEKAVAMISSKKEKEIASLEEQIKTKDKQIEDLEQKPYAAVPGEQITDSREYAELRDNSNKKVREMADMVIQMEGERDMLQEERDGLKGEWDMLKEEFSNFKAEIETAIKDKEAEFKSLREELALTKSASERLQEELNSAECRNKELEEAIVTLKQEMESMSKARKRQISTDESNSASNKGQKRQTISKASNRSISRTSTLSQSSTKSTKSRRSSSTGAAAGNRIRRAVVKTSTRRTSQILINKTLNTTRSSRSRVQPIEESPASDTLFTPDAVGVKRKATLKGFKDMIIGASPRLSKRGRSAMLDVSESDSDFVTPQAKVKQKTPGKRKLHKSNIGSPELIPAPCIPGLKDVVPETPGSAAKMTRSRTKIIQQHLTGPSGKKAQSRNTRI